MPRPKSRPGKIDLLGLFEAAAAELISASEQGRILHNTGNIRDSGASLEASFRRFVGSRLPAPFHVRQGYLFDVDANCTPQIDAMIVDEAVSHELMRSPEGASYVPYPCCLAVVEVKNSGNRAVESLEQIGNVEAAIREMRQRSVSAHRGSGGPAYLPPLSALVIADSRGAKLADFQAWFSVARRGPDYTLLLDRGLLIASRNAVLHAEHLGFYDHRHVGEWGLFTPPPEVSTMRGAALMWLYFAIVAHVNLAGRGNMSPMLEFTNDVEVRHPLRLRTLLASATRWPVAVPGTSAGATGRKGSTAPLATRGA